VCWIVSPDKQPDAAMPVAPSAPCGGEVRACPLTWGLNIRKDKGPPYTASDRMIRPAEVWLYAHTGSSIASATVGSRGRPPAKTASQDCRPGDPLHPNLRQPVLHVGWRSWKLRHYVIFYDDCSPPFRSYCYISTAGSSTRPANGTNVWRQLSWALRVGSLVTCHAT
jgi:hypothetical protein